jgi:SAM-dependent methyltransferase
MSRKQRDTRQMLINCRNVSSSILPSISFKIEKRLRSFIDTFNIDVTPESLKYLKSCYAQPECPEIDYDVLAMPFSYLYFFENFWKSVSVFSQKAPSLANCVVDIGCGSGTTTLGYLTALDASLREAKWKIDLLLIDRSQAQLDLARKVLELASKEFQNLQITPHFECLSLQEWKPRKQSADTILFGHVLNENRLTAGLLLEKAFSAIRSCGRIYIIERANDPIWKDIGDYVAESALPFDGKVVKIRRNRRGLMFRARTDKNYITARYLVLQIPERKQLVNLLRLYFHAWKTQSVDELEKIFEPTAEYYEKPYERPFRGIEQIREYWKKNVLTQRNIRIQILRVAYTTENAFAEWEAAFEQANCRVKLRGTLILYITPENQRISTLHEYYKSKKYKG